MIKKMECSDFVPRPRMRTGAARDREEMLEELVATCGGPVEEMKVVEKYVEPMYFCVGYFSTEDAIQGRSMSFDAFEVRSLEDVTEISRWMDMNLQFGLEDGEDMPYWWDPGRIRQVVRLALQAVEVLANSNENVVACIKDHLCTVEEVDQFFRETETKPKKKRKR